MIDMNPIEDPVRAMCVYNFGDKKLEAAYWLSRGIEFGKTCTITSSQPANFITALGVFKKRKEIEKKGLPDFKDGRFITLTLDHNKLGDAESGYEIGKRHLRQFMYELRRKLGVTQEQCPHAWKLEFHQDGWAHWHLIFLYRKKLPFEIVDACWRLGRTETQRVHSRELDYLFTYLTKDGASLPLYILDRKQVRFWQASKSFYTLPRIQRKVEPSPRQASECSISLNSLETKKGIRKESTLGERLKRWMRTISIRIGDRVAIVEISSFPKLISRAALQAADDLIFGFEPPWITCKSIQLAANRALEFLKPEFSTEIKMIGA